MPFCQNCGTKVDDNKKFCTSCGKPLEEEKKVDQSTALKTSKTVASKKVKKRVWMIVPVVAIFIVAAYFLWPRNIKLVDENLERVVLDAVGESYVIDKDDVKDLVELYAPGKSIESLEGIEKISSLQILELSYNEIQDLSPLNGFSRNSFRRANSN